MNSEAILKSDLLDILFEKRNKLYGAYTLRKFYSNRLYKSISITLGAATILCAVTFIEKKVPDVFYTEVSMPYFKPPTPPEPKKELPRNDLKANKVTQKRFGTPLVVDRTEKIDSIQTLQPKDVIGSVNIITAGSGPAIIGAPATGGGEGGNGKETVVAAPVNIDVPVDNPDVQPAYPGGINALRKFLQTNLNNPTEMEPGEMVAVNVRFVVGYDGKLQKFTIVKDGGEIYNTEVIRVMKKMPQWIPGKAKGENVAVYFTIPVKFVPAD